MENSSNLAHLEPKISRLNSCKDLKKQDRLRYHMISGFLAMVEMMHALRSLWEVFFPFALLWWNVMLSATCARYYSWNRSRFRLQWGGHGFHGEANGDSGVEEIGEKVALLFYQSDDVSQEEMTVLTCYHSRSLMQASCAQKLDLGSGLQSLPSTRELNCGMFLHVDDIVISAKKHHDNQEKEFNLEESTMCSSHVSNALEVLPSHTSKLSFLHFPDEKRTQQSGLLKAALWAAYPFLLPQQVPPLVTCRADRNFLDGTASMQLMYNIIIDFSTLGEQLQNSPVMFVSSVLSMIYSKEHAYFARKIVKYLTSRGCRVHDNVKQLVSSFSLSELDCTRSILSLEPPEGTMDRLASQTGKLPSSSHISEFVQSNDVGAVLDYVEQDYLGSETEKHPTLSHVTNFELRCDIVLNNVEQDISDDEGSFQSTLGQSYDGCVCKCVSGCHDFDNSISDGNPVKSRQTDAGIAYLDYSQFAAESGKEKVSLPEVASQLNESCFSFYDRSADWDVKYGGSHLCQGVDSIYGGYYGTYDQVLSNYSYFTGGFEGDDTISGGLNFDDDTGVQGNSSKVKQLHLSDTWWDEDVVLVGNQDHEEDSVEQGWQVV
ncbi:hypothetical protein L7F22_039665 [Adiantum nelumboides]|nr:hypothetical protein [Adiantum nelumboides]